MGRFDIFSGGVLFVESEPAQSLSVLKMLLKELKGQGIIISASRPYAMLKKTIDLSKVFVIDCVTKQGGGDTSGDRVAFVTSPSALTEISLRFREQLKDGFVIIDSLNSFLIYNEPLPLARFVHSLLIKLRLAGAKGFVISEKGLDQSFRAEIAQLCDGLVRVSIDQEQPTEP